MVAAGLKAIPADQLTDWSYNSLRSAYIDALTVGCVVRVCVGSTEKGGWEKIYFEITKIKDGTYWGTSKDTYRMEDEELGLRNGEEFSFRKQHIMEIPQEKWWQPKSYVKAVAHLGA